MLTSRQSQLYHFILRYQRDNGYAPSHEEMRKALGGNSHGRICELLDALSERRYVRRRRGYARAIEAIPTTFINGTRYRFLPVVHNPARQRDEVRR